MIVDHDNHWVLENWEKATVLAYLQQAKASGLLADVVEVTTDMWDAYVNAAREAFGPQVLVTTDRFHVMKNLQEYLTAARRELQRTLSASEREELKGSRWLWQTNWANLNATQREQLTQLKLRFPTLGALAEQREQFQALLEDRTLQTSAAGQSKLVAWLAQTQQLGLTALNRFAKTLGNWLSPISNYFVYHCTNGRTEGFNHGLRSILWRAYGMTNFQHFRLRVLHSFSLKPT